ncbi:MAG: hypothetical protein LBF97_06350 [Elusimicrobiota bacterium]|jgi:hypothetical protein|nr:hypothetical protein [Elusimicrobiota bacterium]
MKIICENSFYKFYPNSTNELDFLKYNFDNIVLQNNYWTFEFLANLKHFSIRNFKYANLVSTKTYSGRVEKVLLENKFVYDIADNKLKNLDDMKNSIKYYLMDFIAIDGFPMAGNFLDKKRLKSFSGYWDTRRSGIITMETIEFY